MDFISNGLEFFNELIYTSFCVPNIGAFSSRLVTVALRCPHSGSKDWNTVKAPPPQTHYFHIQPH